MRMGFAMTRSACCWRLNRASGWQFCTEGTTAVRRANPRVLQNAEYWPGEYGAPAPLIVTSTDQGGLGCDAVQHDGLREAIRTAVGQAAAGADAQCADDGDRHGDVAGGICVCLADDSVRGESRHREAGREAADSCFGGRIESSVVVRAQQVAGGDGAAADSARDPADVYGAGVFGGQAVVLGSADSGPGSPDLVGRVGVGCGRESG